MWLALTADRIHFTYDAKYQVCPALGSRMTANHVSPGALTDRLTVVSIAMLLGRTAILAVKACTATRQGRGRRIRANVRLRRCDVLLIYALVKWIKKLRRRKQDSPTPTS